MFQATLTNRFLVKDQELVNFRDNRTFEKWFRSIMSDGRSERTDRGARSAKARAADTKDGKGMNSFSGSLPARATRLLFRKRYRQGASSALAISQRILSSDKV